MIAFTPKILILALIFIFTNQTILNAQTTYFFQVAQAQSVLVADAGPDKTYDGNSSIVLG
jgi:hypothetical protein